MNKIKRITQHLKMKFIQCLDMVDLRLNKREMNEFKIEIEMKFFYNIFIHSFILFPFPLFFA